MAIAVTLVISACKSPLALDVDRTMHYIDGGVTPTRVSLYYYYADSSYEVIFTDSTLLNTIRIDTNTTPFLVTIPQLATPKFSCVPNTYETPIVNAFSFSVDHMKANDSSAICVNPKTYFYAQHMNTTGFVSDYQWFADSTGRRLDVGFVSLPDLHTVKGRVVIRVVNPDMPTLMMTFNALVTIDY